MVKNKFCTDPFIGIVFSLLFLTTACSKVPDALDSTEVATESGDVIGYQHSKHTLAWLGIPYAAPPEGKLRWRKPQPVKHWDNTKETLQFGSSCIQFPNPLAGKNAPESELVVGSEDCLTLNIFAPENALTNHKPKPVMFWIHGGANITGTSQQFDGALLASTQDVVVVTINYRLGLLGWIRHAVLREGTTDLAEHSGNFGTLDIISALSWVNRNIAAFGGDPNQITIFGESAGGRNVWSLIQSPLASGLFQRAITQSGTLKTMDPLKSEQHNLTAIDYPQYQNNSAELVTAWFGETESMSALSLADKIRALSPDELYQGINTKTSVIYSQPLLFLDGHVFVAPALELFKDPSRYNSVPIMTGGNRDETKLFLPFDERWVDLKLGFYPVIKNQQRYDAVAAYGSDAWKAFTADIPAKVISENGGKPVYIYRFDFDDLLSWPVDLSKMLGAAHGFEIPFIFGSQNVFPSSWLLSNADERDQLGEQMMQYWGQFAHSGDPGRGTKDQNLKWLQWQENGIHTLILDTKSDGGIRMISNKVSASDLKMRLHNDTLFNDEEKCEFYIQMFLNGYQDIAAYDELEYSNFVESGCPLEKKVKS